MKTLSLRNRCILITFVALLIVTPASRYALDQVHSANLAESTFEQAKLIALMLIGEFEFKDGLPSMPDYVYDEKLNLDGSGIRAYILMENVVVWQSASSFSADLPRLDHHPDTGSDVRIQTDEAFYYSYTAEYTQDDHYEPIEFHVVMSAEPFHANRIAFLQVLTKWMLVKGACLFVALIIGFYFLLRPLKRLTDSVNALSDGSAHHLDDSYPVEVTPLQASISQLLVAEKEQQQRFKNSLGDLAHSLKTPLSVALGEAQSHPALKQPLEQIDEIIQRQLKRATRVQTAWHEPTVLQPLVDKLCSAMGKVHADKKLRYHLDISQDLHVPMQETDLFECLGNLLDNASKAATSTVLVKGWCSEMYVHIQIDDDGPGVPEEKRKALMARGYRLDSYDEGQGIGLAVVTDIVHSYGAKLSIEKADSPLSGARFTLSVLRLPRWTAIPPTNGSPHEIPAQS